MNKGCNNSLLKTLELIEELKEIATEGLEASNDDNCILLYGFIKDCCYRIKKEVNKEIEKHKKLNKLI